jgi:hypothetical protein
MFHFRSPVGDVSIFCGGTGGEDGELLSVHSASAIDPAILGVAPPPRRIPITFTSLSVNVPICLRIMIHPMIADPTKITLVVDATGSEEKNLRRYLPIDAMMFLHLRKKFFIYLFPESKNIMLNKNEGQRVDRCSLSVYY